MNKSGLNMKDIFKEALDTHSTRKYSWSSNPRRIAVVSQMCINIGVIVISKKNALIDPATLTFDLSAIKPHNF